MRFTVKKQEAWDERLEPLVAESRALSGVPPDEARPFTEWVDGVAQRMREHRLEMIVACEDGAPVGLMGFVRKRRVVRIHYLYLRAEHHEPAARFLLCAEEFFPGAHRLIVEGGPQTLLDESIGAEAFVDAGYRRFERARLERVLDDSFQREYDPSIIPLPVEDVEALVDLQRVGYLGSPDYLLVDDFEDMVHEMLEDPWLCPSSSFAVTDGERLTAALYTVVNGPLAWIASLCVHPDARGQRLATRLMLYAMAAYRDAGFERAGLHVTMANRAAFRLYEHMGFTLAERITLLYAKELVAAAHHAATP